MWSGWLGISAFTAFFFLILLDGKLDGTPLDDLSWYHVFVPWYVYLFLFCIFICAPFSFYHAAFDGNTRTSQSTKQIINDQRGLYSLRGMLIASFLWFVLLVIIIVSIPFVLEGELSTWLLTFIPGFILYVTLFGYLLLLQLASANNGSRSLLACCYGDDETLDDMPTCLSGYHDRVRPVTWFKWLIFAINLAIFIATGVFLILLFSFITGSSSVSSIVISGIVAASLFCLSNFMIMIRECLVKTHRQSTTVNDEEAAHAVMTSYFEIVTSFMFFVTGIGFIIFLLLFSHDYPFTPPFEYFSILWPLYIVLLLDGLVFACCQYTNKQHMFIAHYADPKKVPPTIKETAKLIPKASPLQRKQGIKMRVPQQKQV